VTPVIALVQQGEPPHPRFAPQGRELRPYPDGASGAGGDGPTRSATTIRGSSRVYARPPERDNHPCVRHAPHRHEGEFLSPGSNLTILLTALYGLGRAWATLELAYRDLLAGTLQEGAHPSRPQSAAVVHIPLGGGPNAAR